MKLQFLNSLLKDRTIPGKGKLILNSTLYSQLLKKNKCCLSPKYLPRKHDRFSELSIR